MSSRLMDKKFMATPPELQLNIPVHSSGIVNGKSQRRFYPTAGIGQQFTQDDVIKFKLQGNSTIDPRSLRFCYKIAVTDTTPKTVLTTPVVGGGYANGAALVAATSVIQAPGIYAPNHGNAADTSAAPVNTSLLPDEFGGSGLSSPFFDRKTQDGQSLKCPSAPYTSMYPAKLTWVADHGSCVIRTGELSLNQISQVERIDRWNRVRGMLAAYTVDEGYKATIGQSEGYQPRPGTVDTLSGVGPEANRGGLCEARDWQQHTDVNDHDQLSVMHPQNALQTSAAKWAAWTHATRTAPSRYVTDTYQVGGAANDSYSIKDANEAGAIVDGKTVTANEYGGSKSMAVSVPLDMFGFLNQHKLISLSSVGSIDIDLRMEDASVVLNHLKRQGGNTDLGSDRSYLKYEISDVYLTCDTVELSTAYNQGLLANLQGNGLNFNFSTYEVFQETIRTRNAQIQILRQLSNLKTVWVIFADKSLINGSGSGVDTLVGAKNDRVNKTTNFPSFNLESYNILVDGRPATSTTIKTTHGDEAEAIHELAKSFRMHGDNLTANAMTTSTYHSDKFAIGIDFEKTSIMSGIGCQRLQIDLEFGGHSAFSGTNANSNANLTAFVVLEYDSRVNVRQGGQITVMN